MNRLDLITNALSSVEKAREQCPFHGSYTGREVYSAKEACGKCGADRRCDGGRCVIDRACFNAVLAIEEAVA